MIWRGRSECFQIPSSKVIVGSISIQYKSLVFRLNNALDVEPKIFLQTHAFSLTGIP